MKLITSVLTLFKKAYRITFYNVLRIGNHKSMLRHLLSLPQNIAWHQQQIIADIAKLTASVNNLYELFDENRQNTPLE